MTLTRTQLKAQHRRERDKRVCDRIKAVLLCDKGWSIATIAEALLLSEDAIREHITEYRDSKKLKPENGGSTEKLSLKQSELIIGNLRILDQQCLVFFQHWRHLGLTQS